MTHGLPLREELAAFLRSRRERLRPADVGLPVRGKRRAIGLRREEVAQLAGIGVTWYTWLEQGRDVRPSPSVAAALADALRLTPTERLHLHTLIHRDEISSPPAPAVPLDLLAKQITSPAYVRESSGDMIAWNAPAEQFFGNFTPEFEGRPNYLIYLFLNENARRVFKNWRDVSERSVAQFRRLNGGSPADSRASRVVNHLMQASPEFKEIWDHFIVTDFFVGIRVLRDWEGRDVFFHYATLASPYAASPWLTVYLPTSEPTSTATGT